MDNSTATVRRILDFWFLPQSSEQYGQPRSEWFVRSDAFDAQCAEFRSECLDARAGRYNDWINQSDSGLALILLLDQFPRNLFRDSAEAFLSDELARHSADRLIASGLDQGQMVVKRRFIYLPFEHSEDSTDQERSVALFESLEDAAEPLVYAIRHRDIIQRFGRFPHRNKVLGRTSTPEELEFLTQPGSSF